MLGFGNFPQEPLPLKDGVVFAMVHQSFYDVCVFEGWCWLHQSAQEFLQCLHIWVVEKLAIGLAPMVEQHLRLAGKYLLVSILQEEGLGVNG